VNQRFARVAMAAVAPVMLVSAVMLTGGTASAKKAPAATISCNKLTATITWTPPLVPGTATSKTDQITITNSALSGCTTSPTSTVTAATSVTATASKSKGGNSCASLSPSAPAGKPTTYTFTVGWNSNGGTSVIKFKGSKTVTSPQPGFSLTAGKGTGAYATKTAAITAYPNSAGAAAVAQCVAGSGPGITSVTVTSGNVSA